jgi:hypothetical protein
VPYVWFDSRAGKLKPSGLGYDEEQAKSAGTFWQAGWDLLPSKLTEKE